MARPCSSAVLCLCAGVLLQALLVAAQVSVFQKDAQAARAFCKSPEFKKLSCGWAGDQEQSKTTSGQCPWCGTIWQAEPTQSLPTELGGSPRYFQYAGHVASLACQGKVVVRSVFKLLKTADDAKGCAYIYLSNDNEPASAKASAVIRCELQLPAGPGSEAQRALQSKEVNCYACTRCNDGGGCPSVAGRWYSDSYTTTLEGCASKFTDGYYARRIAMGLNYPASIQLAKFEVCSSPSCFNAQYEANKAKTAKKCVKGVC